MLASGTYHVRSRRCVAGFDKWFARERGLGLRRALVLRTYRLGLWCLRQSLLAALLVRQERLAERREGGGGEGRRGEGG